MSSLRVKGHHLSCFYGFIDLKCQFTDCMLQRLSFLIERIHSLQKAVGIAYVSRTLCLSSEVEFANDNEAVSDASQSKREWSSKFLHSMSPIAGSAWFSKGMVSPPIRRRAGLPI